MQQPRSSMLFRLWAPATTTLSQKFHSFDEMASKLIWWNDSSVLEKIFFFPHGIFVNAIRLSRLYSTLLSAHSPSISIVMAFAWKFDNVYDEVTNYSCSTPILGQMPFWLVGSGGGFYFANFIVVKQNNFIMPIFSLYVVW